MDLSRLLQPVEAALGDLPLRAGLPLPLGASDAAKAAVVAAIARRLAGPLLIIAAKESRARDLCEELALWLGSDAGSIGEVARLYPQRDILPYERAADDPWDVRTRLEITAALHDGSHPIVIA